MEEGDLIMQEGKKEGFSEAAVYVQGTRTWVLTAVEGVCWDTLEHRLSKNIIQKLHIISVLKLARLLFLIPFKLLKMGYLIFKPFLFLA